MRREIAGCNDLRNSGSVAGKVWKCNGSCFLFSSRRRHTRLVSDWSSDVCSSDLNQIPVSRFSGPSRYFLERIPLPNGPGQQLTYQGATSVVNEDQFMAKIDWVRGKHQVSGRYFYTKFKQPSDFSQVTQNLLAMDRNGNEVRIQTVALDYLFSVSPTLIFQTWVGFDSQVGGSRSGIPPESNITFPAAGVRIEGGAQGIPPAIEGLNVTGFFSASSNHFGDFNRGDWTIREAVT